MAFDLGKSLLIQDRGLEAKIKEWKVCFMSPSGLHETLEEAQLRCLSVDLDPAAIIIPVPVAVDELGRYEVIVRR